MFYIFISGFVFLAAIRLVAPTYLRELFLSIFSLKELLGLFQNSRFRFSVLNMLLDVLSVIMLTILLSKLNYGILTSGRWQLITVFVALGYLFRLIIIQFFATVFFGRGPALVHMLLSLQFTRLLGLVLLPSLFAALYQHYWNPLSLAKYIIWICAFLYFIWMLRLFFKLKTVSVSSAFYLFLYLCTVELSPLLIVLKCLNF